jgi:arylformamidase
MTTQKDLNWIDVSVPLSSGMAHWPGDPEPSFERISEISQGAAANVTMCRMTAHTGTHMDAPCHFLDGEGGIDRFPLALAVGPARVIEIPGAPVVGRAQLESKNIQPGERVLFKTRNSNRRWDNQDFDTGFVAFDASGARFLADRRVSLVGVDYLSVGLFQGDGVETHQILLKSGIWILEGLNLAAAPEGEYELICLPLRIAGCDGSPARAILRKK